MDRLLAAELGQWPPLERHELADQAGYIKA
jgi:hypothetical protein